MTNNVFIIQTAAGKNIKLVVHDYYKNDAVQMTCNSGGTIPEPSGSGNYTVEWAFLQ
jgi:hypothetical protein